MSNTHKDPLKLWLTTGQHNGQDVFRRADGKPGLYTQYYNGDGKHVLTKVKLPLVRHNVQEHAPPLATPRTETGGDK